MKLWRYSIVMLLVGAQAAMAQVSSKADGEQPIEVVSDTLEVFQPDQKAIFKGNVIATQGGINMRAAVMTVFYRDGNGQEQVAAGDAAQAQGIYKIEADGKVFFTSALETAEGDHAIYRVDEETITLFDNVLLTRQGNVLKGTKMVYNLKTGRSILVGAGNRGTDGIPPNRVRGLFVPQKDKKANSN